MDGLDVLYAARRVLEDRLGDVDDDIADFDVGYCYGGFAVLYAHNGGELTPSRASMLALKRDIEQELAELDVAVVAAEAAHDAETAAARAAEAAAELAAARYALERHQCDMECCAEEADAAWLAAMEEEEKRLAGYVDELESA